MNKNEVKDIVVDEIKRYISDSLDKEMKKVLHNSNSQSRDEIVSLVKNGLEAVFRTLWQKKEFWKTDIK